MADPVPSTHQGLIPHLVCSPCRDAIDFYKKALGAEECGCMFSPDGKRVMHAEIRIGGMPLFLADDFPEYCNGASQTPKALGGTPVTIHRYVENCDAAVQQMLDAGATATMPVMDMFWGDRYGVVTDPFGHNWSFATHLRDLTPEEMKKAMDEAFQQSG
ncbi:MAG: VOC family protein [Pirellulales bacterium]